MKQTLMGTLFGDVLVNVHERFQMFVDAETEEAAPTFSDMVPNTKSFINRSFGRQAFGLDPGGYHAARPSYPDWVFDVLRERCGFAPNVVTFEIGAGTGTA